MATAASAKVVDFTNVKDGGNFNRKRIPAGDYLATITKIEDAEAKDGVFQYLVSIKINKHSTSVLPYYCKLQENQLWKLRNLLIAGGLTVPKRKMKVDVNRLMGKIIGVTVEDDEFDGKEQSGIAAVFPAAELSDSGSDDSADDDFADDEEGEDEAEDLDQGVDDSEEEEEPIEDEEPEEEVDPFDPETRAPLKAAIKELNPEFKFLKSLTNADLQAALDELTPVEDDEEIIDDEEEEEAPAPVRKTAARKPAATTKRKPINEVSDEELEELDIDAL